MASESVATPPPPPAAAHAPDAYVVKERVAIGTAGVVYRAVERQSGREVLFKVLMEQASHPVNAAQVLAISPALMRLKDPRIAELLDAYDDPEGTVLVYPLTQGTAGSEFPIRERVLTPPEARHVAKQLCEALLVGERAAFPHGDVKPSNIVISENKEDGRLSVQLQDWGLSSCRTVQPSETLQFMAPERNHGHPTSVQGDLFSLGACLWFLLTGRLPVESTTREHLLVEWGAFDPSTLAGLRPEVDKHFSQWLSWLLRWQPRDRPPSVAKALEVLNQVIAFVDAAETRPSAANGQAAPAAVPNPGQEPPTPGENSAPTLPNKPLAMRPSTARTERLNRLPSDPPSTISPSRASASPQERSSLASKLMAGVLVCCALAAAGVLFIWWAEEEWGPDWRTEMVASIKGRLRTPATTKVDPSLANATTTSPANSSQPATSGTTTTAKPSNATTAKTASTTAQKPAPKTLSAKPASAKPKAPSPPAANYKPIAAEEPFTYAEGMPLEGAGGGRGWKTPWKATHATVGKTPDGKYQGVLLGATQPSVLSRELDPGNTFSNSSVAVYLELWHPGPGASPLELDLLGTAAAPSDSAIIVAAEGNRLRISIKDATGNLHVNAGAPLKLALKWSFKKKPDGTAEVVAQVFVNPKPGASNPVALSAATQKTLPSYKLPPTLTFTARTTEAGSAPVVLQKVRLAKTAAEAIK